MKHTMSLLGLLLFGNAGYCEASEAPKTPRPPAFLKQRTLLHIKPPLPQSSPLSSSPSSQWSPRSPRPCDIEKYNSDSPSPKTASLLALKLEITFLQKKAETVGAGPNRPVEKELKDCLKKLSQIQTMYPHLRDKNYLAHQISKLITIHEISQKKRFLTTSGSVSDDATEDDITMTIHLPPHVKGALAVRLKSPSGIQDTPR